MALNGMVAVTIEGKSFYACNTPTELECLMCYLFSTYGNALKIKINENEEHCSTFSAYKFCSYFSHHASSLYCNNSNKQHAAEHTNEVSNDALHNDKYIL